ncbi:MAG: cytosine permease [Alicyclobacillus sp.]|nr:cytosine permease [Alicyclobacillus sp.]
MSVAERQQVHYGERVLAVEPYGVQHVAAAERHGRARSQFTLWLGCNLTIADYALGFLPVSLGLPWGWALAAIFAGNLLGAFAVGLCAAMGPVYGQPQLMIGRASFGRMGGYVPAVLNYVSTIGWYTVNNILGSYGLCTLFPQLPFWLSATLLAVVQSLLAIYGHNLIHLYERVMSVVLGVLFCIVSVIALRHSDALLSYHPAAVHPWPAFWVMVAAAFSYIGSWGPYASDYSRYLPPHISRKRVIGWAFLGSFVASVWLELVGAAVAVLAGHPENSIHALHSVMGGFGGVAVVAIILGGTAADALNLYSNALSAGAFDVRLPRWVLALAAGVVGWCLSLLGSGGFEANYENFLLLLGYWMTPWLGVLFADFYLQRAWRTAAHDVRRTQRVYWPGLGSFLLGVMAALPFMSSALYTGPVARALHGVDLAFYVGFAVSLVAYLVWQRFVQRVS